MKTSAMILAAGLGTRLRPLTDSLAKPAVPFLGIPMGLYGLHFLRQMSLQDLVVNLHHLPETVRDVFDAACKGAEFQLHYSDETSNILGSGGGVAKALPMLFKNSDEAIIVNGDEVLLFDHDEGFAPLLRAHRNSGALATLLTTCHDDVGEKLGGIWVNDRSQVFDFGKTNAKTRAEESAGGPVRGEHFTGVYVISKALSPYFSAGESHIFYDVLMAAIKKAEPVNTFYDERLSWFETGNPADLEKAQAECQKILDSQQGPQAKTLQEIICSR